MMRSIIKESIRSNLQDVSWNIERFWIEFLYQTISLNYWKWLDAKLLLNDTEVVTTLSLEWYGSSYYIISWMIQK